MNLDFSNNSSNCPEDARLKQVDQKDIDDDEKRSTATDKHSDLQNNDVRRGGMASKRQDSLLRFVHHFTLFCLIYSLTVLFVFRINCTFLYPVIRSFLF